jgi:hypothetical protein
LPGAAAIKNDYRRFQTEVTEQLKAKRLGSLKNLTHNDFCWAVNDWITAQVLMS